MIMVGLQSIIHIRGGARKELRKLNGLEVCFGLLYGLGKAGSYLGIGGRVSVRGR